MTTVNYQLPCIYQPFTLKTTLNCYIQCGAVHERAHLISLKNASSSGSRFILCPYDLASNLYYIKLIFHQGYSPRQELFLCVDENEEKSLSHQEDAVELRSMNEQNRLAYVWNIDINDEAVCMQIQNHKTGYWLGTQCDADGVIQVCCAAVNNNNNPTRWKMDLDSSVQTTKHHNLEATDVLKIDPYVLFSLQTTGGFNFGMKIENAPEEPIYKLQCRSADNAKFDSTSCMMFVPIPGCYDQYRIQLVFDEKGQRLVEPLYLCVTGTKKFIGTGYGMAISFQPAGKYIHGEDAWRVDQMKPGCLHFQNIATESWLDGIGPDAVPGWNAWAWNEGHWLNHQSWVLRFRS